MTDYEMRPDQIGPNMGRNLRLLREERGLSQQDVADRSGLSRDAVAKLEKGIRGAGVRTLMSLCKVLGVEPPDLLKFNDDPPIATGTIALSLHSDVVLLYVERHPGASVTEVASVLQITEPEVRQLLRYLWRDGKVKPGVPLYAVNPRYEPVDRPDAAE
jgi:DNA-binding Xre family transcriptional regulator